MEGLKSVFDGRAPDSIQHSESVAQIADEQTLIGWGELLRGRLSLQWKMHFEEWYGARATSKRNADTWAAGLSEILMTQWLDAWTDRNADRHGRDRQSREEAARRQAMRETTLLYEQHQGMIEPHLNWILATPLEQRLQNRTYVLRAWISNFGPILKKSHEYQTRLETG